jgi:hypothetical protein
MKLQLTLDQCEELKATFQAIDGDQVVCGQIIRERCPNDDAGTFVLKYTLINQATASKIRKLIEKARGGHPTRKAKARSVRP